MVTAAARDLPGICLDLQKARAASSGDLRGLVRTCEDLWNTHFPAPPPGFAKNARPELSERARNARGLPPTAFRLPLFSLPR